MDGRTEKKGSVTSVTSWVRGCLLGAGAFGQVNLALNTENGELFAVKSVECSKTTQTDYIAIQNEKHILQSLQSPFVISYLGSDCSVENGKSVCNIFLEYMPGGSLTDLMKKFGGRLNEQLIRTYTKGILQGLQYIHSEGVVHCDIKGQNVLVGSSGIKLADFGSAKTVCENRSGGNRVAVMKGTPLWMAPEVVRQEEQGTASDIWSLGCTVVEMATGRAPWSSLSNLANHFVALYHIGCSSEVPDLPSFLSPDAKDFLEKCLCRDPRQRWTSSQLLQHPFITKPLLSPLPFEALKAPVSPNSVLDRDWDTQASFFPSVPTLSLRKHPFLGISSDEEESNTKERRCEPASESSSSSGWGTSPLSPPAGKWVVVHSPKGSSPDFPLFNGFSSFANLSQPSTDHASSIGDNDTSSKMAAAPKLVKPIHNTPEDIDLFHETGDASKLRDSEECSSPKGYPSSAFRINVTHVIFSRRKGKHRTRILSQGLRPRKVPSWECFCIIYFSLCRKIFISVRSSWHPWKICLALLPRSKLRKHFVVNFCGNWSIQWPLVSLQCKGSRYNWNICVS